MLIHLEGLKHAPHVVPDLHVTSVIAERVRCDFSDSRHAFFDLGLALLASTAPSLGVFDAVTIVGHGFYSNRSEYDPIAVDDRF